MKRASAFITLAATLTCSWNALLAQQDAPSPAPSEPPLPPTAAPPAADPAASPTLTEPGEASSDGMEQLARGPLHESFARPVELNPSQPPAIRQKPPEPIEEVPPEARPDGNAEWIPGYWSWDDDRSNFLWVSGTWRVIPSGQRWVPGYWTETTDGYVRVPGFWSAATSAEVEYLPEPPQTLEQGPVGDAPSEQHFWLPGSWVYRNADYSWRPGYWARGNADWMWIPDNYVWTPSGYVYTAGYWDFPYVRRGILFPPVFFGAPIYQNPGFFYTPSVGINLAGLHIHLFARPRFNQFYFGDYYGDSYLNSGFFPWFAFNQWNGYDPFYNYYGFRFGRGDRNWDRRFRDRYQYYRDNRDARPAHTYLALQRQLQNVDRDRRDEAELLVSLDNRDRFDRLTARKINRLNEDDRRQIARRSSERVNTIRERRLDVEKERRVTLRPADGQERDNATQRPRLRLPDIETPRAANRDRDRTDRDSVNPRDTTQKTRDRVPDNSARDNDGDNRRRDRDAIPDDNRRGRDVRDGIEPRDRTVPGDRAVPRDRDVPDGGVIPRGADRPRDRDIPGERTLPRGRELPDAGIPRREDGARPVPDRAVPKPNLPDGNRTTIPPRTNVPAPGQIRREEAPMNRPLPNLPNRGPNNAGPSNRPDLNSVPPRNLNPQRPTSPPQLRDAVPRNNRVPQTPPRNLQPTNPNQGGPTLRGANRPVTPNVPNVVRPAQPNRAPAAAVRPSLPKQAAPPAQNRAPKQVAPPRATPPQKANPPEKEKESRRQRDRS
ncbi:MAG: hypothetical protein AB7O26_19860 [Planctomycetaceae bacterium]